MAPQSAPNRIVTVEDTHNGGEVTLAPGETLTVRLASNLSTGYSWHLVWAPDASFLRLVDSTHHAGESLPGAPGVQEVRFTAEDVGAGVAQAGWLRMLSLRPWESSIEGASLWQIKVTVQRSP